MQKMKKMNNNTAFLVPVILGSFYVSTLTISVEAAEPYGIFTVFFPTKLRLNSTANLEVIHEISPGNPSEPPPLRLYIECTIRPGVIPEPPSIPLYNARAKSISQISEKGVPTTPGPSSTPVPSGSAKWLTKVIKIANLTSPPPQKTVNKVKNFLKKAFGWRKKRDAQFEACEFPEYQSKFKTGLSAIENFPAPPKKWHFNITKISNWRSSRRHRLSVDIPGYLNSETMETCTLIAEDLVTTEILDITPLKLESATRVLQNPDRISKIFVQMDKPVYKPKDLVRIRLVLLDKNFIPSTAPLTPVEITILDSRKLLVFSQGQSDLTWNQNGLGNFSFYLADQVNLGQWTINVTAGEVTEIRSFTVEKYVLPKFEIKIIPEKKYLMVSQGQGQSQTGSKNNTRFTVEIQASYTYGKSLYGNYTLLFFPTGMKHHAEKMVGLLTNGRAFVSLPIPPIPGQYQIEVKVSESTRTKLTGRWIEGKKTMEVLHEEPYILTWLNPVETYNPGFPLQVQVAVSTPDKLPVVNPDPNALCITASTSFITSSIFEQKCSALPQNGIVTFDLTTMADSNSSLHSLTVQYAHKIVNLGPIPRPFYSPSKIRLNITPRNERSKVKLQRGQTHDFILEATYSVLQKVNYILWDGHKMVGFEVGKILTIPDTSIEYEIPVHKAILPAFLPRDVFAELQLFVYFVHDLGGRSEIISASITLPTSNYVEFTPSRSKFQPADQFNLTIKSHPKSTVAVRAIDQSVLLLSQDANNLDLDPKEVPFNELWTGPKTEGQIIGTNFRIDFRHEFQKRGLAILTNADQHSARGRRRRRAIQCYPVAHRMSVMEPEMFSLYAETETDTVRTRTEFPEVWLWDEFFMENETQIFTQVPKVPDTMTSWYLTAFSINKESGLAVTSYPKTVQVFLPFFVTMNLPYSVVQGETFDLQVLVHNYLDKEVWVNVTFINDFGDFLLDMGQEPLKNLTHRVLVPPNVVDLVIFVVTPVHVGQLPVIIQAVTEGAGDAIRRPLNVIRPGETVVTNVVRKRIEIKKQQADANLTRVETIITRHKRTLDSRRLRLTGNVLAPNLQLDDNFGVSGVLDWSLGCGEQNLVKFYPTVISMDYLASLNKLTPTLRQKGVNLLTQRYQTQLTYYNPFGHFSFMQENMKRKSVPSTWLTAYVLQTFAAAYKYIKIDPHVLINSVKFVLGQQNSVTGEFIERADHLYGNGYHMERRLKQKFSSQNNKESLRYGISAYIVLALMDAENGDPKNVFVIERNKIEKAILEGVKFISSESSYRHSDGYSLAIVTAALHMTNHVARDRFFDKLELYAKVTGQGTDDKLKHYEIDPQSSESSTSAISIEMTAYALMAHLHRSQVAIGNSASIVRWLYSKQNSAGNYYSTQDTVVAIKALAEYSKLFSFGVQSDEAIDVVISTGHDHHFDVHVSKNNSVDLQEMVLPKTTEYLNMTFKGHGVCHLDYEELHYRSRPLDESGFKIRTTWSPSSKTNYDFDLRVCVNVKEEGEMLGQVLAQIGLTTGFAFYEEEIQFILDPNNWTDDEFTLEQIEEMERSNVTRIDLKKQGTQAHVLYSSMSNEPSCVTLPVSRLNSVYTNNKAHIHVFEYYNPGNNGTAAFDPAKVFTICDICLEANECKVDRDCRKTRR